MINNQDDQWVEDMAALIFTAIVIIVLCCFAGIIYWIWSAV